MSAIFDPRVKDIVAVVTPAIPVWAYLVSRYDLQLEDGSSTKEWTDAVLRVLGFGFIPRSPNNWSSVPCYLVADTDFSVSWLAAPCGVSDELERDRLVTLRFGKKPKLGIHCDSWLDGYSYHHSTPSEESDMLSDFIWIIK